MTEEVAEPTDPETETDRPTLGPDPALGMVAKMANLGTGVSITVVTGGTVISGGTMSGRDYFLETQEAMRSATVSSTVEADPDEAREVLPSVFEAFLDLYPDYKETAEWDFGSVAFIHLRNAYFVQSGHIKERLRLRLSEISGWSLGEFSRD